MNCHHNVAQLRRLQQMFPDELVVIGVHSAKFTGEQGIGGVRQAVMRHGIEHPVVNDPSHEVWQQYAVRAWPTVLVVDPERRIVQTLPGEIRAESLAVEIRALIAQHEERGTLDRRPLDFVPEAVPRELSRLNFPSKVLVQDWGSDDGPDTEDLRLFIADTGNHRIVEARLRTGEAVAKVQRVFGDGTPGLRDGDIRSARFHAPHGMARKEDTLYVADTENHAVRAIDLVTGRVRTVAGTGEKAAGGMALGKPTETPLRSPWALVAIEHLLFIAMAGSHQIWVLIEESELGPFAGNGREALVDGPRDQCSFNQPSDLVLGMNHLFVADAEASAIRAISLDAEPKTFTLVGQGLFEWGDADGSGAEVRLQHPAGLAYDDGQLYLADSFNHKIKAMDPTSGRVWSILGSGEAGRSEGAFERLLLDEPEGLSARGAALYVADTNNHRIVVADLDARVARAIEVEGLASRPPEPATLIHAQERGT